jgi:hypothetical protein
MKAADQQHAATYEGKQTTSQIHDYGRPKVTCLFAALNHELRLEQRENLSGD